MLREYICPSFRPVKELQLQLHWWGVVFCSQRRYYSFATATANGVLEAESIIRSGSVLLIWN